MFQHRPVSPVKWDIALFIACSVHQSRMTFVARGCELMLPEKLPKKKKVADCQVMSAFCRYINKVTEWWGLAMTGTSTPSGSGIFIRLLTQLSTWCLFQAIENRKTGQTHTQTFKWNFLFFFFQIYYLHLKLKWITNLGLRFNITQLYHIPKKKKKKCLLLQ